MRKGSRKKLIHGSERRTTSNRVELLAAIGSLEGLSCPSTVTIYSSSTYITDGATSWLRVWRANDWKKASGATVMNADLWARLAELLDHHAVTWERMPARGNLPLDGVTAMRLAQQSATQAQNA